MLNNSEVILSTFKAQNVGIAELWRGSDESDTIGVVRLCNAEGRQKGPELTAMSYETEH